MFRRMLTKKAQTTLEYAILIGVIVAALIAMQTYIKRGYQGKLREHADSMGEQFSPGNTTYNYTSGSYSNSTEELVDTGITTTTIHAQTGNKTGAEDVQDTTKEKWWNVYGK